MAAKRGCDGLVTPPGNGATPPGNGAAELPLPARCSAVQATAGPAGSRRYTGLAWASTKYRYQHPHKMGSLRKHVVGQTGH